MARLTIPDEPTSIEFTVTAAQSEFPISFSLFSKADLRVLVGGANIQQSAFTFTGTLLEGGGYKGGVVRLNTPVSSTSVRVSRRVKPVRPSNFPSQNSVPVRTVDMELNKIVAQQQDVMQALVDVEKGVVDPELLREVVDGATAGKLEVSGSNIPLPTPVAPSGAVALRRAQNLFFVTPEDFGGRSDDPTFDNAPAIARAEAYLALAGNGGALIFGESRSYYFASTITITRNGATLKGNRSRLIYNGTATSIDLLVFGNGVNEIREVNVDGLEVCTETNMTAPSTAVHLKKVVRSNLRFDNIQGQYWQQTHPGIRIWHGVWANQVDNVRLYADGINATGDGIRVNGAVGTSGPKADFWPFVGKVSGAANGLLLGGGFGGLYLTPELTLINNKVNLRVDQSLCAEQNRELFCTGSIFDVASGNQATDANVILDDPGDLRSNFTGCWFSAGQSHGVWIKRSGGKTTFTGGRIIGMKGDAFRTDAAGSGFTILAGMQISDNTGWAINGRVNGHSVIVDACWFASNTLGMVNTEFTNNGLSRNEAAQFPVVHTTKIQGDTGDFLQYNRAGNLWESFNGNVSNVAWGVNSLRLGDGNPFIRYAEFSLSSAPSGAIAVTHGDSNMPRKSLVVQAFYNDGGVARALALDSVGPSAFNFAANANAVGKPVIAFAWYLDAPRTW